MRDCFLRITICTIISSTMVNAAQERPASAPTNTTSKHMPLQPVCLSILHKSDMKNLVMPHEARKIILSLSNQQPETISGAQLKEMYEQVTEFHYIMTLNNSSNMDAIPSVAPLYGIIFEAFAKKIYKSE